MSIELRPRFPNSLHLCPQAASEDELRYALGLTSLTTGKGKVDLKESNMRPIEVFMCSVVRARPRSCPMLHEDLMCMLFKPFSMPPAQQAGHYCQASLPVICTVMLSCVTCLVIHVSAV